MRKAFAIAAIFCLLLITGGYQLFLYLRIAEAKQQIKAQIRQSHFNSPDIIKLKFTESELKELAWENDAEFEYRGEMYDVLNRENGQCATIISCIQDKKETALIEEYIKSQQSSPEKRQHPVLKLLAVQFISIHQDQTVVPLQLTQQQFVYYLAFIPLFERTVTTPPPRLA